MGDASGPLSTSAPAPLEFALHADEKAATTRNTEQEPMRVEEMSHPSYLELDRLALGAERSPETSDHVRNCGRCTAYLAQITSDRPVPGWARALSPGGRQVETRRWARWVLAGGLAGAAAAVGLVLVLATVPGEERDTVVAKGTPAVGVYIRRGGKVALWDGRAAILPGDTL